MLEYNLDISEKSVWISLTPDNTAKAFPFFITEIGRFIAGENYFTKRSGKKGAFLMYTLKGEGTILYKDSEGVLSGHSAVIIDCGDFHYYKTASKDTPWDFLWFHFDGEGIKAFYPYLIETLTTVYSDSSIQDKIENVIGVAGIQDLRLYAAASHMVSSVLTAMLLNCIDSGKDPSELSDPIEESLKYIHSHYAEDITLDRLAEEVNLSKYHLAHLFKARTGISPYNYVLKYRINQSKQLLRRTALSIEDIALMVGFSSSSNYIHRFSLLTNQTPHSYRKDILRF